MRNFTTLYYFNIVYLQHGGDYNCIQNGVVVTPCIRGFDFVSDLHIDNFPRIDATPLTRHLKCSVRCWQRLSFGVATLFTPELKSSSGTAAWTCSRCWRCVACRNVTSCPSSWPTFRLISTTWTRVSRRRRRMRRAFVRSCRRPSPTTRRSRADSTKSSLPRLKSWKRWGGLKVLLFCEKYKQCCYGYVTCSVLINDRYSGNLLIRLSDLCSW